MNSEQKERIKQIIENDCMAAGVLLNEDGETCAIGALLIAAGEQLEVGIRVVAGAQGATLFETFGIGYLALRTIMSLNDDNRTPALRRSAIIKYLDTIPVEETVA